MSGRSVTASGLTPGGNVAVVAGWWTSWHGSANLGQKWRDAKADAQGAIEVAFTSPLPDKTFLAVIDIATGRIETRIGDPRRYRRLAMDQKQFKNDGKGEFDHVASPHDLAMIILVRPGEGAWIQIAGDGGGRDADGRSDGFLTTKPEAMWPMAQSAGPPKKIRKKDVVLIIDAAAGAYTTTEVQQ